MTSTRKPVLTNVGVYRSIADAAYRTMAEDMDAHVRRGSEGRDVLIKIFDPEQLAFKQAMTSIVFTCIWLEATLHLLVVQRRGREGYTKSVDRYVYEG